MPGWQEMNLILNISLKKMSLGVTEPQNKPLRKMQPFHHPRQNNLFSLPENIAGCSTEVGAGGRGSVRESLWNGELPLAAARLYKEPQWQIQSDQQRASSRRRTSGKPLINAGTFSSLFCRYHFLDKQTTKEKGWR